jgi:hypothetical protein
LPLQLVARPDTWHMHERKSSSRPVPFR